MSVDRRLYRSNCKLSFFVKNMYFATPGAIICPHKMKYLKKTKGINVLRVPISITFLLDMVSR